MEPEDTWKVYQWDRRRIGGLRSSHSDSSWSPQGNANSNGIKVRVTTGTMGAWTFKNLKRRKKKAKKAKKAKKE